MALKQAHRLSVMLIAVGLISARLAAADPVSTAFAYQGQLRQAGVAVNDLCDFEFRLFDSLTGGVQIGPTLTFDGTGGNPPVSVSAGLFTVKLDFGIGVFVGDARFVELRVRCPSGAGAYTLLSPRQPICAAPYALFALDSPPDFNLPLAATIDHPDPALQIENQGGHAFVGISELGSAAVFQNVSGLAGTEPVVKIDANVDGLGLRVAQANVGPAASFLATNVNNAATVLSALQQGTGRAGLFQIAAPGNTSNALEGVTSAGGVGVFGNATAPGGTTIGVRGRSASPDGTGVAGSADATTGASVGVSGTSASPDGTGVYGNTPSGTGTTVGVHGESASLNGQGVFGNATAPAGGTIGVRGRSASPSGTGVAGSADAMTGFTVGVSGTSASPDGTGVFGNASAGAGTTAGVHGESASPSGRGVFGHAAATNGAAIGVYGLSANAIGAGVKGESTDPVSGRGVEGLGTAVGVAGTTSGPLGSGVLGTATSLNSPCVGVRGTTASTLGAGVLGENTGMTGGTSGVAGTNTSNQGNGVFGLALSTSGATTGVRGETFSSSGTGVLGTAPGFGAVGVKGMATGIIGVNTGVVGESSTFSGTGVYGKATRDDPFAITYGVVGEIVNGSGAAVQGIAPQNSQPSRAVLGINGGNAQLVPDPTALAVAVEGISTPTSGAKVRGVRGVTNSANGIAVEGLASNSAEIPGPPSIGVLGTSHHPRGTGVRAVNAHSSPQVEARGLYAEVLGPGTALEARVLGGNEGVGVKVSGGSSGVEATSTVIGLKGTACDPDGLGVVGIATGGPNAIGVRSIGKFEAIGSGLVTGGLTVGGSSTFVDLTVTGTLNTGSVTLGAESLEVDSAHIGSGGLSVDGLVIMNDVLQVNDNASIVGNLSVSGIVKQGGSFRIDHPLDPGNKYLYHSFVESPDMMNIYNGNVTTDERGYATVELPNWFEALNRDFRYQLTVIGTFAQAIVAEKVRDNRFVIRTDRPNVEVSWQVTGIRQDPWANANRIPVEVPKPDGERGTYRYPETYGQSAARAIK